MGQEHASGGYKERAGGWESNEAAVGTQEKGIRGKGHSRKKCFLKMIARQKDGNPTT